MIDLKPLLSTLDQEEIDTIFFFLEDMKLTGRSLELRNEVLAAIVEQFPY